MAVFMHELVCRDIIAVISGILFTFAYCTLPHAKPMACNTCDPALPTLQSHDCVRTVYNVQTELETLKQLYTL